MRIVYHKDFIKRFKKLSPSLQKKVVSATELFTKNPHDPVLKNHALVGKLHGLRSFSVTGDVRVIFEEHDAYMLVVFLDVGTHNQVY